MPMLQRNPHNPLLIASCERDWESVAAFNPSVVRDGALYRMLYRAQGAVGEHLGQAYSQSCIGMAVGTDVAALGERCQIIQPDQPWDRCGCEDPRVTRLGDMYYVFYTCLSVYPFEARGIRVGVAVTRDFQTFEKHPVTPFNAKAMALFPERIDGQMVAVLTVHTDMPPAKIAIARFDREEQIWSDEYWRDWYRQLDQHVVPLLRHHGDLVEVGAAPVRTERGWLLLHAYIRNYYCEEREFAIEAALLDPADPRRLRGRSNAPLLKPEKPYEVHGNVRNVVFPSGALAEAGRLDVYYGAADSCCCSASIPLADLLRDIESPATSVFIPSTFNRHGFQRYSENPIIAPRPEFAWEALATFNPAAIDLDGRVHLVYRAMALDGTSTLGYAASSDGIHVDERLPAPIYEPRAPFELKQRPGNSGCEDPRLTLLDDTVYLVYTAYDGCTPRVACSSLPLEDFLGRRWNWKAPTVITPPGIDDKDACLLSKKLDGQYVIFHRQGDYIRVNRFPTLDFGEGNWVDNRSSFIRPRKEYWDNRKFGIAAPPIETSLGWLLFFHRVTRPDSVYKIEAMLLDARDPSQVIAETAATLLEPEAPEERFGQVPNVVFPCGAVVRAGEVYLYYGGADRVVCVARMSVDSLLNRMDL